MKESKSDVSRVRFINLIDTLNLPKDKTIIIGSSLLVATGHIETNNDIDVIVPFELFEVLRGNPLLHYKTKDGIDILSNETEDLEIIRKFVSPLDWTYEEIEHQTLIIDGYKFMNPRILLDFYYQLNRPKDLVKIIKLQNILQNTI